MVNYLFRELQKMASNNNHIEETFNDLTYQPLLDPLAMAKHYFTALENKLQHRIGDELLADGTPWSWGKGDLQLTVSVASVECLGLLEKCANAASAAATIWSGQGHADKRAQMLYKCADNISERQAFLSELLCVQSNSTLRYFTSTVAPYLPQLIAHYAGWAARSQEGQLSKLEAAGVHIIAVAEGSCITEFVYTLVTSLAAGNTLSIAVESNSDILFATYLIVQIFHQAGLTGGIINLLTVQGIDDVTVTECMQKVAGLVTVLGRPEVVQSIVSRSTGAGIRHAYSHEGRQVTIVLDSADLDSAADDLIDSVWCRSSVYPAASVLLIQESVEGLFLDKLRNRMKHLRVGERNDLSVDVTRFQSDRYAQLIQMAQIDGGQIYTVGGEADNHAIPTLVTGIQMSSPVLTQFTSRESVLVALPFRTMKECLSITQNISQLCTASVWSENHGVCLEMTSKLSCQTVFTNCHAQYNLLTANGRIQFGTGLPGVKALLGVMTPVSYNTHKLLSPHDLTSCSTLTKDVKAALTAANKAVNSWSTLSDNERAESMRIFANQSDRSAEDRKYIAACYERNGSLQSTSHGEIKELTHPFGVIVVSCSAYFPALRELALKLVTQGNCVVLIIQQCDSNLNVSTPSGLPSGVFQIMKADYVPTGSDALSMINAVCYYGTECTSQVLLKKCSDYKVPCWLGGDFPKFARMPPSEWSRNYKYNGTTFGDIFAN